jgi:hypothetical protein
MRDERARSEKPTIPTRTLSLAPPNSPRPEEGEFKAAAAAPRPAARMKYRRDILTLFMDPPFGQNDALILTPSTLPT